MLHSKVMRVLSTLFKQFQLQLIAGILVKKAHIEVSVD